MSVPKSQYKLDIGQVGHQDILNAKAWAKAHGYSGEIGGWIRRNDGTPVAHGWARFYLRMGSRTIDNWARAQGREIG
jgi:hypothetical protein